MRAAALVTMSIAATLLLVGCTDESQTAAPVASPTLSASSSDDGSPVEEAQAVLDGTIAAMDNAGSIAFTTEVDHVVVDERKTFTGSGVWTARPPAWTVTTAIDGPSSAQIDPLTGVETVEELFVGGALYSRLAVNGKKSSPWIDVSHLLAEEGKSQDDYESPTAVGLLSLTEATATSDLGGTLSITGTVPTSWALEALVLDSHLDELGFGGRFEDSTTRVLITVRDDGLPQTLKLEGSAIDISAADLPDYVVEELAQARYLATYDDAELDAPIETPRDSLNP